MKTNVIILEEYNLLRKEILKEINKVFSSGQLILGPKVKLFENKFSKFVKHKYGIGVNSGTGLQFILSGKIGKGDEVITVSNTAVPTVSAIVSTGAKPVFVDVNEDDYLINVSKIVQKITKRTKAIIPVNLYGQCADYDSINKIAKKNNLLVLEDRLSQLGLL